MRALAPALVLAACTAAEPPIARDGDRAMLVDSEIGGRNGAVLSARVADLLGRVEGPPVGALTARIERVDDDAYPLVVVWRDDGGRERLRLAVPEHLTDDGRLRPSAIEPLAFQSAFGLAAGAYSD